MEWHVTRRRASVPCVSVCVFLTNTEYSVHGYSMRASKVAR
jgi:hypothetical protein